MRAAIYARVSTTDQTCDLQLRELRQYITAREIREYLIPDFSSWKEHDSYQKRWNDYLRI
jgi:DNA invertase Pin-like site-specific DNA recombinase